MNTEKAMEFLQKEFIEGNLDPMKRRGLEEIIALLEAKQELVTKLSEEGDEYQKKLDRIDELALLIESANERIVNNIRGIRGKI